MTPTNEITPDQIIRLKEENQRLHKAVDELSILNELSRVISSNMNLDFVIETIVKRSLRAVNAQQGTITLVDESTPSEMKTLIRAQTSTAQHRQFHLTQNIIGWMLIHKQPLLSNDVKMDSRFSGVHIEDDIHSMLCVPMLIKNRMIAVLSVFNKKDSGEFTDDDKRLLSIMATQSAQVIENARLYEQERQKMMLEKELIAAREVQMRLLPQKPPKIEGFNITALTIPAKEVGGDYYDFIPLDDKTYEIVVADVSGKGLPAALLAAMGKGVLYAQAYQHPSPQMHLQEVNRIIRRNLPRKSFITMILAVISESAKTVLISNAGHCCPLFYKSSQRQTEVISIKGMALNFSENIVCTETRIELKKNDVLLLYSDGIIEAQNISGELFGIERLQDIVAQNANLTTEGLGLKILEAVKIFTQGVPQNDDITLVALQAS